MPFLFNKSIVRIHTYTAMYDRKYIKYVTERIPANYV